jgi:hypothetical protein
MAHTSEPAPVKYFIAVLYKEEVSLGRARALLCEHWGSFDYEGEDHRFDVTAYYEPEMGAPLYRRLLSFVQLRSPVEITGVKLECNGIETALSIGGKRAVNLDAGYLDHNKVLLASAKEAGQKIYLDKGIYADLAGRYKAGKYQPFEWSFPDFRDGRYDAELIAIRTIYLDQLRQWRKNTG